MNNKPLTLFLFIVSSNQGEESESFAQRASYLGTQNSINSNQKERKEDFFNIFAKYLFKNFFKIPKNLNSHHNMTTLTFSTFIIITIIFIFLRTAIIFIYA